MVGVVVVGVVLGDGEAGVEGEEVVDGGCEWVIGHVGELSWAELRQDDWCG